MNPATDRVAPDQRIIDNRYRSGMRSTETPDDDATLSTGWTWVAALSVAALFIVAGYLDQESGILETSFVARNTTGEVSSISMPPAPVTDANWADRQSDKGY